MSFFVAVVGLLLLVAIHELGHFSAAKATGMRALRFYLGFPPAILKRTWRGTEYGIGAIPLGGFVKIPGMLRPESGDVYDAEDVLGAAREIDEAAALRLAAELADLQRCLDQGRYDDARAAGGRLTAEVEAVDGLSPVERRRVLRSLERLDQNLDPDAYWRCSRMRRLIVIAAGPFANVVACFAILTAVALYGLPVAVPVVQSVLTKSPASATGLRAGDRVVSVNGHHAGVNGIRNAIADSKGGPVRLVVVRDGHRLALRTERSEVIDGAYRLGFQFGTVNRLILGRPRAARSRPRRCGRSRRGRCVRWPTWSRPAGARSCTRRSASSASLPRRSRPAPPTTWCCSPSSRCRSRSSTCCRSCRWTAATSS